jgi:hypothetical protein
MAIDWLGNWSVPSRGCRMPSSGVNRAASYGNSLTQGSASRASIVRCVTQSAREFAAG